MAFSLKQKIDSFFFALLLVSTINFGFIILAENKAKTHLDWVIHSYKVIDDSEKLLQYLIDAETGQRGFLLVQNREYLQPYISGKEKSLSKFSSLNLLTKENAAQQLLLEDIKLLMDEKFFELNETIKLVEKGRMEDAMFIVSSDIGKLIMDELRRVLGDFQSEERITLAKRESIYSNFRANIRLLFIVEYSLFAMSLIILSLIANKTIIAPIEKLTSAAKNLRSDNIFNPVSLKNKDEIGELAQAFNDSGTKIKEASLLLEERHIKDVTEKHHAVEASITDLLTGLHNRRYMNLEVDKLITASHRYKHDLCVIFLDIDHFKKVNDIFGHIVGDQVLQALARLLKENTRNSDLVIRFGGEEFIIVVPNSMINEAEELAEKLRISVSELVIPSLNGANITISLGITKLFKGELKIESAIHRADKALYKAKSAGRNQVCRG